MVYIGRSSHWVDALVNLTQVLSRGLPRVCVPDSWLQAMQGWPPRKAVTPGQDIVYVRATFGGFYAGSP